MDKQKVFIRTDEERKRCEEIHDKFRDDLLQRQLSNSENYDKTIISLSSAGLALSLTAIRFVVPLDLASHLWLIKLSWILFFITIICSIVAYQIGNKAISRQMEIAEDYYLTGLVSAQKASNPYSKINSTINNFTGVFFLLAISSVTFFVIINLNGEKAMTDKNKIVKNVFVTDSAMVPKMQIAPGLDGRSKASADIPTMQLAPGEKPEGQKSTPPSSESKTSK